MRNGAQHPLPQGHLDGDHAGVGRVQDDRRAVEPRDGSTIQCSQQIREIDCDEVDERRVGITRLLVGEGSALVDRFFGKRDIAMTPTRKRSGVRRDVCRGFLRHRLVHLLATARNGMSGADVCAGRHRGDVGGNRQQKAG